MSDPGSTPPQRDDEAPNSASRDAGETRDPSRAGGGRTTGETNVDDDLGRGDATGG